MHKPYESTLASPFTIECFQSLEAGNANERQQKEALRWLIDDACKTYDLTFFPGVDGGRDSDFAQGKRFVGLQVITLLKVNPTEVRKNESIQSEARS